MQNDNTKIVPVDIEREMKKSYLDYSMSVIVGRALPDVRDGLKPVHRRILYTMYEDNITPDKPHFKSAATVGTVLARYHPHGEAAVYDTLVRLAQDFVMRFPLIDGNGNFGSVDGDPPAAMRYTEARMSRLSIEMLTDIEKETVDFMPSYDSRREEPVVLPSRFPNLLVNGSSGIAVGMATNIPPHNLGEVIDAAVHLIDRPEAELDELSEFIKGPDFPTGAMIMGRSGIRAAYATGRGAIKMRARAEIEDWRDHRFRIAVTEIPYQVNKARLIENIADHVKEKRIEGISDLRDESDRNGMRIVIELKRDANPQIILNQLYKFTQMQDNFSTIMLALVDNQPRVLTLKETLQFYIIHQKEVVIRRTRYDMRRAKERAHILEGLLLAVDNIDEVLRIIRAQKTIPDARAALMERFAAYEVGNLLDRQEVEFERDIDTPHGLTDEQATAIVNMRFGQLVGLERERVLGEYTELMGRIAGWVALLADESAIFNLIKEELLAIKAKYSTPRKTEIVAVDDDIDIEDLIKEEDNVFTLTHFGYIKRLPVTTYRAQKRGGKGVAGLTTREEDFPETIFVASTHDYLLFFTNQGRMHRIKGYRIPEAGRTAKGMNLINLIPFEPGEKVAAMIPVRSFGEGFLTTVTRNGIVKRTALSTLDSVRKAGIRALAIDEGDELISVNLTDGEQEFVIATRTGQCIRFGENELRPMGRTARGVIGIRLSGDDYVVGAAVIDNERYILTVTENGYGKCSSPEEYRVTKRGGKGIITHNLTEKTGALCGIAMAGAADDLMLITNDGNIIRMTAEGVRVCGRNSQGVILRRTGEDVKVISIAMTAHEEPEEPEEEDEAEVPDGAGTETNTETAETGDAAE